MPSQKPQKMPQPSPVMPVIPDPTEHLDTMMLQRDDHHEQQSGILDALLLQTEKNDPNEVLDHSLQMQGEINDELKNQTQVLEEIKKQNDGSGARLLDDGQTFTIRGVKGEKGDQGIQGEIGPPGPIGPEGPTGPMGPQGPVGPQAPQGEVGPDGRDGRDGRDGQDGLNGKDGLPGRDGASDTGEDIVQKLHTLPKEKQLSYNDLKDAPEWKRHVASRDYAFTELTDTPKSYDGKAGLVVKVNSSENGLEFGQAASPITFVDNELVTGAGTAWSLAAAQTIGSEHIYGQRSRLYPGFDYTIDAAGNITTVLSYSAGDLLADYRK